MVEVFILKKRKDFVRVASKGLKVVTSGLILQAALSLSEQENCCHIGYTATKKLGKAHIRNRTKRRLRAAVREVFPQTALSGVDYVLIGRYNTATCDFQKLTANLQKALEQINAQIGAEKTCDEQSH